MKQLEDRIKKDGIVLPGNVLKVGHFLNQNIDIDLLSAIADEIASLYSDSHPTKVFTVEASGIAVATAVGLKMGIPVVFAKKHTSSNVQGDILSAPTHSYTHGTDYDMTINRDFLDPAERILIVDDFLAVGGALKSLISLVEQSGAQLVGCAIMIEKAFQGGGDELRAKGIRVESLAQVETMSEDSLTFRK